MAGRSSSASGAGGGPGGGQPSVDASSLLLHDSTRRIEWSLSPLHRGHTPEATLRPGTWVIVTGADGGTNDVAELLSARLLQSSSARAVRVRLAGGSSDDADAAADAALAGLAGGPEALAGVVFLAALDPNATSSLHPAATHRPLKLLLALVRSLARFEQDLPRGTALAPLFVVTRGAPFVAADSGVRAACTRMPVRPQMSALIGMARVLTAERTPGGVCRVVDLCPGETEPAKDAHALLCELSTALPAKEAECAIRMRQRYVPALSPLPLADGGDAGPYSSVDANGTYLVTGATGGLGMALVRTLVQECGVRRVVLMARSNPKADVTNALTALERETGAKLEVSLGDVAVEADVERVLGELAKATPPCKGILHLAGVVDDGFARSLTWDRFAKCLAPKVEGSLYLHDISQKLSLPLEHFVLFSSIYGLLGSPQLTHYAAANHFQDGLAHARRALGLPGLAVSWGTWADAGMASRFGAGWRRHWESQGMGFVPLDGGMATLMSLMGTQSEEPHAGVFPVDWARYTAFNKGQVHALGAALAAPMQQGPTPSSDGASSDADADTPLVAELRAAAAGEPRLRAMRTHLARKISELLDIPVGSIDATASVVDLGLSSMHTVDLTQQLEDELSIAVSPTVVFEGVTLSGIAAKLVEAAEEDLELPLEATANTKGAGGVGGVIRPRSQNPAVSSSLAVVGMGCRFPGDATSPEKMWANLIHEMDAVIAPPAGRPTSGRPSGYISAEVLTGFDAATFSVPVKEAHAMDPQQRLLLHVAHDAFLDAHVTIQDELEDRSIGIFLGITTVDYFAYSQKLISEPSAYSGTSWSISIAANRISFHFDLQGPSMCMDTACSSSLTTLDVSRSALALRQCSMALVAGVNIQILREWTNAFVHAGMLSPSNRCKFGDDSADGYVRGEGCGGMTLLRFDEAARARGDLIYGLIVSTGVNQDGRSNGLTAPNPAMQEKLLHRTYVENAASSIDPTQVSYVEAHGTGTRLGDPIEVRALGSVLSIGSKGSTPRAEGSPLRTASVKSNVGHLECGAGMVSLIKAQLIMSRGRVPASLHFRKPNSLINWSELRVAVVTQEESLSRVESAAAAAGGHILGTSGFGFGGTNAHAAMRQFRPLNRDKKPSLPANSTKRYMVALASSSEKSLRGTASKLAEWCRSHAEDAGAAANLSLTCGLSRSHAVSRLKHRAAVFGQTPSELQARLRAIAEGDEASLSAAEAQSGECTTRGAPTVALVFTGQGSELPQMGKALWEREPVYREAFEKCLKALKPHCSYDIGAILYGGGAEETAAKAFADAAFVQPALFAVEYSIAQVILRSLGSSPAVMLGHSIGEVVAACVSGALSLEQACALAAGRGRAMSKVPEGSGAMAAVRAPFSEELERLVDSFKPHLDIAALNGPNGTVLSGRRREVEKAVETLQSRGLKATMLKTTHGFHSAQMDKALPELRQVADPLEYASPMCTLISNVTGRVLADGELGADYWLRHARGTVKFRDGIETALMQLGCNIFVEVGVQPHLQQHIRDIAEAAQKPGSVPPTLVPTLRKGTDSFLSAHIAVAALYIAGAPIAWETLAEGGQPVRVPPPQLNPKQFWIDAQALSKEEGATADDHISVPIEAGGAANKQAESLDLTDVMDELVSTISEHIGGRVPVTAKTKFKDLGFDLIDTTRIVAQLDKKFAIGASPTLMLTCEDVYDLAVRIARMQLRDNGPGGGGRKRFESTGSLESLSTLEELSSSWEKTAPRWSSQRTPEKRKTPLESDESSVEDLKSKLDAESRLKRFYFTRETIREWIAPFVYSIISRGLALIVNTGPNILMLSYLMLGRISISDPVFIFYIFTVAAFQKFASWFFVFCAKWAILGRLRPQKIWRNSFMDHKLRLFSAINSRMGVATDLEGTFLLNLYYRSLGARIGKNVLFHASGPQMIDCMFDLLDIGDGAIIEDDAAIVNVQVSPDGTYMQLLPVFIGKYSVVGNSGMISAGTRLGTAVKVYPCSYVQGFVPSGGRWKDQALVPLSEAMEMPVVTVHQKERHSAVGMILQLTALMGAWSLSNLGFLFFILLIFLHFEYTYVWHYNGTSEGGIIEMLSAPDMPLIGYTCMLLMINLFVRISLLVSGVVVKWTVFGKLRPGTYRITRAFYFRWLLTYKVLSLVHGNAIPQFFFSTFWNRIYLYMLGGKKIHYRAAVGNVSRSGGFMQEIDLLTIGGETHMSAIPYFTCASVSLTTDSVTYTPVVIGEDCFIGFACTLLPGATIESLAGVSENAVVHPGELVKRGTIKVGQSKLLAYKAPSEPWQHWAHVLSYMVLSGIFFNILDCMCYIPQSLPATYVTFTILRNGTMEQLSSSFFILTTFGTAVAMYMAIPVIFTAIMVIGKWVIIQREVGRNDVRYPDRCIFMARWYSVGRLIFALNKEIQPEFNHSPYIAWIFRMMGSKIENGVRISELNPSPDYDKFTIKRNTWIFGRPSYFSHKFAGGGLQFFPITMDEGTSMIGYQSRAMLTVLLPGVSLGKNTQVGPATILMPGKYPDYSVLQGNPGRPAQMDAKTGIWVREKDSTFLELSADAAPPTIYERADRLCGGALSFMLGPEESAAERTPLLGKPLERVVVEATPRPLRTGPPPSARRPPVSVILSGHTPEEAAAEADALLSGFAAAGGGVAALAAGHARAVQARAPDKRATGLVVTAGDEEGLIEQLSAIRRMGVSALSAPPAGAMAVSRSRGDPTRPRVVLLFGGDSSYINMGKGLYESCAPFRRKIDDLDLLFRERAGIHIRRELYQDLSHLKAGKHTSFGKASEAETGFGSGRVSAAAMFCVQHALAKLVTDEWGITPTAILGYSNGEIAAACAAGMVTVEEVAQLFGAASFDGFIRGRGAMATVSGVDFHVLTKCLQETGDRRCVISGIYSASSYMLSGPKEAIESAQRILFARGITNVAILNTPYPAHCELLQIHMDPAKAPRVHMRQPKIPYVSCATGDLVTAGTAAHVHDWGVVCDQPVRFSLAMDILFRGVQPDILLDISVRADLTYYYNLWKFEHATAASAVAVSTLRMDHDAASLVAQAKGVLALRGVPIRPGSA